ncbi:MAG TPA: PAS domain S-box protein [Fimbriimonas sp.]
MSEDQSIERALWESEARLRAIVTTAVDGILTIDEQGTIEWANPAAESLFGYGLEEMVGENVKILMPEPYRSEHDRYLEHYLETGERRIIGIGREVSGMRKDGSVFPMDLAVSEVVLGDRRLFTGIVRDVTARVEAAESIRRMAEELEDRVRERTEELLAKNDQLQRFCHTLAHDLRQHIRGIGVNAQIVLRDHAQSVDEEGVQHLESLAHSARKLAKLTDDILEHAKLGQARPRLVPVDLSELAQDAAIQVRERFPSAEIRIEPGMRADADPALLRVVFVSLLDNACKFSQPGKPPRVEVGRSDDAYFVRDHGVGFDMRYYDKLFTPFERLHSGRSNGSGIGLANVLQVVDKHKGKVWAESEPGHGATFFFTLD